MTHVEWFTRNVTSRLDKVMLVSHVLYNFQSVSFSFFLKKYTQDQTEKSKVHQLNVGMSNKSTKWPAKMQQHLQYYNSTINIVQQYSNKFCKSVRFAILKWTKSPLHCMMTTIFFFPLVPKTLHGFKITRQVLQVC